MFLGSRRIQINFQFLLLCLDGRGVTLGEVVVGGGGEAPAFALVAGLSAQIEEDTLLEFTHLTIIWLSLITIQGRADIGGKLGLDGAI